jgi:hypothetical protein
VLSIALLPDEVFLAMYIVTMEHILLELWTILSEFLNDGIRTRSMANFRVEVVIGILDLPKPIIMAVLGRE